MSSTTGFHLRQVHEVRSVPSAGELGAKSLLLDGIRRQVAGDAKGAIQAYQASLPKVRWALGRETPDGQWVYGPDFLIIGAARSGTSWLKKRLSAVSPVRILAGEPNYFSFRWNIDPREYVSWFASDAVKNAGVAHDGSPRIYGEKSPSYMLMSHTKISLLKALFPDVKIISLLREPVERGWSDIRRRTDDFEAIPDLPYILRMGHYANELSRWGHHIPPSRMHFIDYEDIRTRPQAVLAETLGFLGLDPARADIAFGPAPALPPPMPASVRAMLEAEYAGEAWRVEDMRALTTQMWEAAKTARKAKVSLARAMQAAETLVEHHRANGSGTR